MLIVLLLGKEVVLAQQTIGVAPALLNIKVDKGKTVNKVIDVYNDGEKPIQVRAEFLNFKLSENGHVMFLPIKGKRESWSAASWLKLPSNKFSVLPGKDRNIVLTISPPADAEPGTHRALVKFSTINPLTSKQSKKTEVLINASVSTVILVKVAGKTFVKPTMRLNVAKVYFTNPLIRLSLGNRGNVHYFANGNINILNRAGKVMTKYVLKKRPPGAMVLPKAKRSFAYYWRKAPYIGLFKVKAQVVTDGKKYLSVSKKITVIRWEFLLIITLLVILIVSLYLVFSRYKLVRR